MRENLIVLFGGVTNSEGQKEAEETLNDFFVFNISKYTFYKIIKRIKNKSYSIMIKLNQLKKFNKK